MSLRYLGGIIKPSYNPLAANVTISPTVVQTGGVYTLQQQAQAQGQQQWSHDPYFNNTTLLLHADNFVNGSQNNTFLDSSTNNATVTRNGTPTQGTFTPYGNVWSNYFNGTDSTLRYTSSGSAVNFTGAYTIECFFYLSSNLTYIGLFSAYAAYLLSAGANGATGGITLGIYSSGSGTSVPSVLGLATYGSASPSSLSATGLSIPLNTWHHVVVVRDSSNVTSIYLNGVRVASATISGTYASQVVEVGGDADGTNYYAWFPGYISNMRVVKGTAVYDPTQTSLNVPTAPLTAITNTSLLTCQSNRFIDNSTNAFAITVNGSPSVQRFAPFSPSSGYSPSVYSGSGYFNGSTDWLSATNSSALQLNNTTAFTLECWLYPTLANTRMFIFTNYNQASPYAGYALAIGGAGPGNYEIQFWDGATWRYFGVLPSNTWSHVAVCYQGSGTTGMFFVNGVQIGASFAVSSSINYTSGSALIGAQAASTNIFSGYINDLRLVKGTAVYTAAFTPPSAPLTNIANTSLLLSYTNAGIYDNGMQNALTTVGNTQVSTSVVKYGSGSIYLNGSASGLQALTGQGVQFGSGNFTIECWVYFNSTTGAMQVVNTSTSSTTNLAFALYKAAGTTLQYFLSSTGTTWDVASGVTVGTVAAATWYHVALVRNGSTFTPYLNGVAGTTTTSSASLFAATRIGVGNQSDSPTGASDILNGYIDDLRVTKGVARYLSNFTPPQVAMANQ